MPLAGVHAPSSVVRMVSSGCRTADLGGHAGTREFADAVVKRTRTKLEVWSML